MKPAQIVSEFYAAGAAGDLDALHALFAEDAVWDNRIDDDPMGGLYEGRESIRRELLERLFRFLPGGIQTTVERVLESGDTVVCLNTGRGTTVEGHLFEKRYAHIFDVEDGLIVRMTEFRA